MVHQPVMLKEVVDYLDPHPQGIYLDMTVGAAGHAVAIAQKLQGQGKILGIDKDKEILAIAESHLALCGTPYSLEHAPFSQASLVLERLGIKAVDGILFDLGVSSYQLDLPKRGFSFGREGPLDMRMNLDSPITAADVLATYSEKQLSNIFYTYGEEPQGRKIARKIVEYRTKKPIKSTLELAAIVCQCYDYQRGKIHPATKIFQALRICVNQELQELEKSLESILPFLSEKGRMVIISFHSLEDRIVKQFIKANLSSLTEITEKPATSTKEEQKLNPRSRSARLRCVQKK